MGRKEDREHGSQAQEHEVIKGVYLSILLGVCNRFLRHPTHTQCSNSPKRASRLVFFCPLFLKFRICGSAALLAPR